MQEPDQTMKPVEPRNTGLRLFLLARVVRISEDLPHAQHRYERVSAQHTQQTVDVLPGIVERRTAEHETAGESLTKHLDRGVSLRAGVFDGVYLVQHKVSAKHPDAVHFPDAGK